MVITLYGEKDGRTDPLPIIHVELFDVLHTDTKMIRRSKEK